MTAHRNLDPLPGPGYDPPAMSADALLSTDEVMAWCESQLKGDSPCICRVRASLGDGWCRLVMIQRTGGTS